MTLKAAGDKGQILTRTIVGIPTSQGNNTSNTLKLKPVNLNVCTQPNYLSRTRNAKDYR